jgi:hypothetical protein
MGGQILKNNVDRFVFFYAIILCVIDLFIFIGWFFPFESNVQIIFNWIVTYLFYIFMVIYFIELIISVIILFSKKISFSKTIRRIIPQITLSSLYLFVSISMLLNEHDRQVFFWCSILPLFLTAISLFFSHIFITGYVKNRKIMIYWKIMSSVTSFALLFSIFGMEAASV